jgi:hypothetical protein
MESNDSAQGGLPRRESRTHAGIGLPGGRRQVKMPDTVRPGAMPPRASGGSGLPSRRVPEASPRVAPVEAPREASEGLPAGNRSLPQGGASQGSSQGSSQSGLPSRNELPPRKTIEDALPSHSNSGLVPAKGLPAPGERNRGEQGSRVERSPEPAVGHQGERVVPVESPRVALPSSREVDPVSSGGVVEPGEGLPSKGSSHGGYREPKRQVSPKSPLAGSELWEDEDVPDTHLGLNAEAPQPKKAKKPKLALTKRDIEIITLCARYRFAYREQIQHYFQSENVRNRLTRLADEGLLRKDMVTQNQALWLPSQAGLDVADLDLTHIERGRYSATSIAHSIGLLNLGIEIEKGWENLLKEDVWPNLNRVDRDGNRLQGETVITEREIANSFNRLKGIAKGDARKTADTSSELLKLRNDALGEIPAPGKLPLEMREGMAGLFVGYFQNKSHTPDMVIARPRSQDGTSNHIAIELELNPKPIPDWIRILRSFKADPMFKSVIYFTHKRSIVNQLTEVNKKHVGLTPEQFRILKYSPRNGSIPFWG